ncbi:hypothetical protein PCIT_a3872 [Pseudoalteromonas citrea]|uniref:HlyD family secretion protein n=2 Tax=Pseudoalteromonas citrea TaxID=43655 RepID=A0AAD4AGE2_9GAMM|nr:hypothetical protein [Pseudoalteromonas citrea]KAF7767781.1 hypothetical protein PCIT_a3872 [Pseudoalteromonas citrea]
MPFWPTLATLPLITTIASGEIYTQQLYREYHYSHSSGTLQHTAYEAGEYINSNSAILVYRNDKTNRLNKISALDAGYIEFIDAGPEVKKGELLAKIISTRVYSIIEFSTIKAPYTIKQNDTFWFCYKNKSIQITINHYRYKQLFVSIDLPYFPSGDKLPNGKISISLNKTNCHHMA